LVRHLLIAGLVAASLAACQREGAQIDAGAPAATPPPVAKPVATEDAQSGPAAFVAQVGASDLYEMEAARIALLKSQNQEVRAYAQLMIDDHARLAASLRAAVDQAGLNLVPPGVVSADNRVKLDALNRAAPADFDKAYVAQQVEAHTTALAVLLKQAQAGPAPLKTFAEAAAPTVQAHLDRARQLRGDAPAEAAQPAPAPAAPTPPPAAAPQTPQAPPAKR
jgi:putative membrane protein